MENRRKEAGVEPTRACLTGPAGFEDRPPHRETIPSDSGKSSPAPGSVADVPCPGGRPASSERGNSGLGAAEDERVDVVGAFVSIDDFEIDHVAGDRIFVGDSVSAEHVAGQAGDV